MMELHISHSRKRRLCIAVCFLIVFFSVIPLARAQRCLKNIPEVHPKKYLYYEDQSRNITLETSSRASHQLMTYIFKIFLQEVVGYPNVVVHFQEDHFQVREVIERLSGPKIEEETIPHTMISVEVWVPPELDLMPLLDINYVNDGGNVAPSGRFGWFIPNELMGPVRSHNERIITADHKDVHWTLFRDHRFASIFDITGRHFANVQQFAYDKRLGRFYCNNSTVCQNGMFTPPQCRNASCALLLASYYNDTEFVIEDILDLKLYVKVIWLGEHLKQIAAQLTDDYKKITPLKNSILIFSWTPSDVIVNERNYTSALFTHCELLSSHVNYGCKYELMRLVKFSWSKLNKYAEPAHAALHRFRFEREQLEYLLELYDRYSKNKSMEEIACSWLQWNESWWKPWTQVEKKAVLYIGGIFPITGSSYNGKCILKSAKMATDAVNRNTSLLNDYDLQLFVNDGKCQAETVMKAFIDYIVENYNNKIVVGVLGPACSDTVEPLAGVSKLYDIVVISYSAEGSSFSDRAKYPYFFRTIGENKQYKHVYMKLFKEFQWKRIAALTEDGQKYTEYISHMQELLESNGITISNTKFPRERDTAVLTRHLEELKRRHLKIIIADVYDEVARTLMCEAYKLGMTAREGYVWFLPMWLNKTFYDTNYYNQYHNENVNCTTAEMIKAISGYFAMTHAFFAADDQFMQENRTVGEWKKDYESLCRRVNPNEGVSNYGGFAYDAVWTYAFALDKLIKMDPVAISNVHSQNSTNKLVQLIKETDFHGVSGHIKFRGGPSRISVINIMQWYDNETHIVGHFNPTVKNDSPEIIGGDLVFANHSQIRWFTPDGKRPDDGTAELSACRLRWLANMLDAECDTAFIVLNVIVAGIFIIMLVVIVLVIKNQYEKKVQLTQKYIKSLGLDVTSSTVADLDKWEIPRECLCINRKLGEGAFGTVYGGEADIPEKGWWAVAVKTLKSGSTSEEKIDFLTEAEVMKRFDHKNIVQLLGVCTKSEPIYTVMEFMLYGDLKTYLLARRHLANEKSEESEEISSKKLTSMALDIARGLSYLADLKYVHRDLASRNCLVNAQRMVKIADFGMTRPMFENDYYRYRFSRKGMLPVRWMSPESLGLGVFTPASDIWSYGVVLYEIISFGSFPFQGMSNSQVVEHIKSGNSVTIPPGVKPQLECLMKSCWQVDSKVRPTAKEIVEFLANNPRLVFPCLDVPLASVQLEDTGQMEMHLPDNFRKCSSASVKPLNSVPSLPNGISNNSPSKPMRQLSIPDSTTSLQMDSNCLREPLLGPVKSSPSLMGLSKLVGGAQHNRESSRCGDLESYPNGHMNGQAISRV